MVSKTEEIHEFCNQLARSRSLCASEIPFSWLISYNSCFMFQCTEQTVLSPLCRHAQKNSNRTCPTKLNFIMRILDKHIPIITKRVCVSLLTLVQLLYNWIECRTVREPVSTANSMHTTSCFASSLRGLVLRSFYGRKWVRLCLHRDRYDTVLCSSSRCSQIRNRNRELQFYKEPL